MNIISTLKEFGVIQELNDWRKHFTDGTKGQPKTDPEILDYVEELLYEVFEGNEEKVNNCRLAPWTIKIVKEIGISNITEEQKNKLTTVLKWFKKTGNDTKVKTLNLDDAFEYCEKGLTKEKEKPEEKPEEADDSPHLQAEKEGRIKRIYSVNDGSKRIWIEVIDGKWLTEEAELNKHEKWGVRCQVGSDFTGAGNQNIQLIGPPSGNPKGPWSTQVGMSGRRSEKNLREIKQEGNHQPGSQKTAAGYDDADERIIDLLCFASYAKENILKLTDYNGSMPTVRNESGAGRFLIEIIRDKPNLLNKLADHREDLIEMHRDLIMSIKGIEWFDERNIDIRTLAETNPEKFLDKFEKLIDRFPVEALEELQKINLAEIYKKNPDLILKNISSFVGRIPPANFENIFKQIDLDRFISSYKESFKNLVKFLSNEKNEKSKPEYSKIFDYILNEKTQDMISAFGSSLNGIKNFMNFAESPRLRKHQNAFYDSSKKEYKAERQKVVLDANGQPVLDENGRAVYTTETFTVPDNLKVLDRKERKNFIEKNKNLIKSLVKGSEFEKELSFLKFYSPQLSDQEMLKIFGTSTTGKAEDNMRNKIIEYFEAKYDEFEQDRARAEKMDKTQAGTGKEYMKKKYGTNVLDVDGNVILKKFEPGILQFYKSYKFSKPEENLIPLADLKKNQGNLIGYFYRNSKEESDKGKKLDAFIKFLQLCKENKLPNEEILKFIRSVSVDPKINPKDASYFYRGALKALNKKLAISEVKSLKDLFGPNGQQQYQELVNSLSIKKYLVSSGDRVAFKGNGPNQEKFNLINGKRYLVIDVKNSYSSETGDDEIDSKNPENITELNSFVKVSEESEIENGGQNIWVPSSRFDIRTTQILDYNLNESFAIFEHKFKKLKNIISEVENKKPRYSAVMLDDSSKGKLLNIIDDLKSKGLIGQDWAITADHITINMGSLYDQNLLGRDVNIKVIGIGMNDKVVALKVSTDVDINYSTQKQRIPHITLAFNKPEGAKPVMSNEISNWENFENIKLRGVIEEVY